MDFVDFFMLIFILGISGDLKVVKCSYCKVVIVGVMIM